MGQIVRRKRRGRPSNTDRARINYSAAPPSPVDRRRSRRRRNVRYNFDIDDYVDDDEFYSDEDAEVGRREKKLRLLLSEDDSRPNTRRVRHAPASSSSSSSSDDYDEDNDVKHSKKRKINADDGGEDDDEDNEIEEIRRRKFEEDDDEEEEEQEDHEEEEEALGGSALHLSKGVPLPDKKTLELILDKLQKKDTYGVYAEPVDPDELPDYHDVIKHPMDFSTVRKKLAKGAYLTLKEFESDVFLICTNAMQYNAPDTIYYKQASSIQEQAKLRFQKLRSNVDRSEIELNTDNHKVTPSFSPPKKQLKRPVGRPMHDPIGSETLSGANNSNGANNVRMEEFPNRSSAPNSSEVLIAETCSLPDNSLDKEQELETGKSFVSKIGMKPVQDENRRATYDTSVEPVMESESIFSIFEGESKQFIPVGLHADHSYARSLARFAATLGSVAWKVASQTIEQSLPAGVKYGRGWVGEYEPLPTTVLILPGDYTLKESNFLEASRSSSNNKSPKPTLGNNVKHESLREEPIQDPKPPFFRFPGSNSFEGPPQVETVTRNGNLVSLSSFKHPNNQNDGFAPGRATKGNSGLVSWEQQSGVTDPVRMAPSFKHLNNQNDGFAPGRGTKGNPTPVCREQQPGLNDPVRMMPPAFQHPNSQNDGFAPGRPIKGNPVSASREQQVPGLNDPIRMTPSFKHPNSQNDGFAPGRPSKGNPTPVIEPGLSDPVQMMKMLAERTQIQIQSQSQSQSQGQHNNSFGPKREDSKRDDSSNVGGQAWMSLGGTHKQQIPMVVESLNNRYQPQVTRFRGEVHYQQQQQQPVQAFVPQQVQNNRHVGFPQLVTADLSRFQVQPSWRGVSPQQQQQLRPKQQESCPPDLNIGYHQSSPVRQSTGMLVDSQQPDLALQL